MKCSGVPQVQSHVYLVSASSVVTYVVWERAKKKLNLNRTAVFTEQRESFLFCYKYFSFKEWHLGLRGTNTWILSITSGQEATRDIPRFVHSVADSGIECCLQFSGTCTEKAARTGSDGTRVGGEVALFAHSQYRSALVLYILVSERMQLVDESSDEVSKSHGSESRRWSKAHVMEETLASVVSVKPRCQTFVSSSFNAISSSLMSSSTDTAVVETNSCCCPGFGAVVRIGMRTKGWSELSFQTRCSTSCKPSSGMLSTSVMALTQALLQIKESTLRQTLAY